ncbi:hydantoinase/oxoprolinase N-terminal domain-containing protein [Actinomadura kijaniata]|uniref:hydantoinase/oxoprolinase N-terminal domain-containing protein n=1 Tax=Actinomadura kijaniata TaxID=46161 RepID=UPI003F1D4CDC
MIVGVEAGPTNTDAVLLDEAGLPRATAKVPSVPDDPVAGVRAALRALPRAEVTRVAVGLRGPARAVVERRGLARVGVLRVGGDAARAVPPLAGWPPELRAAVCAGTAIVEGGGGFSAEEWTPLDEDAVARFAAGLAGRADAVAITGVFAPVDGGQERRAAEIVRAGLGEVHLTLSGELGPLGLLERENTAVLNAALHRLAGTLADGLRAAFDDAFGAGVPALVTRGDGTVMGLDHLRRHPGLGLGSSLASTLRGAATLTGHPDAVVADVGEHRIRVGAVTGGYPRQASGATIGGVPVAFWMPDLIRVPRTGPDAYGELAEAVDRMQPAAGRLPLVVVGGGAGAVPAGPRGAAPLAPRVLRPEHGAVAGAIGAAVSPVGGQAERLVRVGPRTDLEAVLAEVREEARAAAVRAGADPRAVEVSEVTRSPLPYLPGVTLRLHARAAGPARLP